MDAKITLSFDEEVIQKAKLFAEKQNISLSRLTEHLLRKIISGHYTDLEDLPVADWVNMVSEGEVEYKTPKRSNKKLKEEFFAKKK
jgi:hypothetical protein